MSTIYDGGLEKDWPFVRPAARAEYRAEFQNGKLVRGTFSLDYQQDLTTGWISLGQTNLSVESLSWTRTTKNWGLDSDGNLLVYAEAGSSLLNGRWQATPINAGSGRFSLKLPLSLAGSLVLKVPEEFEILVDDPEQIACTVTPANNGFREWKLVCGDLTELSFELRSLTRSSKSIPVIAKAVHLFQVNAAGIAFVSDYTLEQFQDQSDSVRITLPESWAVTGVELNQQKRDLTKVVQDSTVESGIRMLTIPRDRAGPVILRVRGTVKKSVQGEVDLVLPQIPGLEQLSEEITFTVESPYHLQTFTPKNLEQLDARFIDRSRDTWRFQSTSREASLKVLIGTANPRLRVRQLIEGHSAGERQHLRHQMYCTATESGLYQASFQFPNAAQIGTVSAWDEQGTPLALNWTTQRQNGKSLLWIDCGTAIPVRTGIILQVTLSWKRLVQGELTVSLPALIPQNGVLERCLLDASALEILRTIPEQSAGRPGELPPWLKTIRQSPAETANAVSQDLKLLIDLTEATRTIFQFKTESKSTAQESLTSFPVSECQLVTQLVQKSGQLWLSQQISIPSFVRQQTSRLTWITPPSDPLIEWSGQTRDGTVVQLTELLTRYLEPQNGGQITWVLSWPDVPGDLLLQREIPWPQTEGASLPLPRLLHQAFQGTVINSLAEFGTLTPLQGPQNPSGQEWTYSQTSAPLELQFKLNSEPESGTSDFTSAEAKPQAELLLYLSDFSSSGYDLEWTLQIPAGSAFSHQIHEITFPETVYVRSIWINDLCLGVEQNLERYQLPVINAAVQQVRISYSLPNRRQIMQPQVDSVPDQTSLVVCVPRDVVVQPGPEVTFWKQIPSWKSQNASPGFQQLVTKAIQDQTHLALKASLKGGPSTIPFVVTSSASIEWGFLGWFFLVTSFVVILLRYLKLLPELVSFLIAFALLMVVAGGLATDSSRWILVVAGSVLMTSQVMDLLVNWLQKFSQVERRIPKRGQLSTLVRQRSLSILLISLACQQLVFAQDGTTPGPAVIPPQPVREDVLIPVPSAELTSGFSGLDPSEFPSIVYVTPQTAAQLKIREFLPNAHQHVLFHSASYEVASEGEGLQIRCRFDLIENAPDPLDRVLIPITGVSGIQALRAVVNGKTVSLTPLPGDQGLEVSLVTSSLSALGIPEAEPKNALSRSYGNQSSPFRRYQIELVVIPRQTLTEAATLLSLQIPAVVSSQLVLPRSLLQGKRVVLRAGNRELVPEQSNVDAESLVWNVGHAKQLALTIGGAVTAVNPETENGLNAEESSLLIDLTPHQLDLAWKLVFESSDTKLREFVVRFPDRIALQDTINATLLKSEEDPNQPGFFLARFQLNPSASNRQVVLLRYVQVIEIGAEPRRIELPRLVQQKGVRSRQLGIQPAQGGLILSSQSENDLWSRMTVDAFQAVWGEAVDIQPDASCYRITGEGAILVAVESKPSFLTVSAETGFQVQPNVVIANSVYNLWPEGQAVWQLSLDNSELWTAEEVILEYDGHRVATRSAQIRNRVELYSSEPLNGPAQIRIKWRKDVTSNTNRLLANPPRVLGAGQTTQTVRLLPGTSRYPWTLVVLDPASRVASEVMMHTEQVDANGTLFSCELRRQNLPPGAEELPLGNDSVPPIATSSEAVSFPAKSSETAADGEQKLIWDHTIFAEAGNWLGESILFWPADSSVEELQVTVPTQYSSHKWDATGNLNVEKTDGLTYRITRNVPPTDESGLLRIQWGILNPDQGHELASIPLCVSTGVDETRWRVVNRWNSPITPQNEQGWSDYLVLRERNTGYESQVDSDGGEPFWDRSLVSTSSSIRPRILRAGQLEKPLQEISGYGQDHVSRISLAILSLVWLGGILA
ncbi:MAG: hypothetical protein KDA78_06615, partial [Planctomycetaceae bacterium]|nr:hypothetical protein [Planctomycetaceae bacterium]